MRDRVLGQRLTREPLSAERSYGLLTPDRGLGWGVGELPVDCDSIVDERVRSPEEEYEYREVRAPERLVYTWSVGGTQPETLVTIDFEESGSTTLLHLTHDRFVDDDARKRHGAGWAGVLDRLVATLGAA